MKIRIIKVFIIILLFINLNFIYPADKIDELAFTDTEVTEVLKTISEIFQITIVPDKEVKGPVTRFFKGTNLEQTLTLLLEPLDFRYEVKDGIYFVKKKTSFTVDYDVQTKLFNIKSEKAKLTEIISDMAKKSQETLRMTETNDLVTAYIYNKSLEETIKFLTEDLNYEIKKEGNTTSIKKKIDEDMFDPSKGKSSPGLFIKGDENNLNIKILNKSSNDLVMELFRRFDKKVSMLSNKSIVIPYMNIVNVTFDDALNIIFEHSNQAFTKADNFYYVYDSLGSNSSNLHRSAEIYKLKNIDYNQFSSIIPSQIIPQSSYKVDQENNTVILFGSPTEVSEYLEYIKKIDDNRAGIKARYFKLDNIDVKNIKKYLPVKYQKLNIITIDEQNIFSAMLDDDDYNNLNEYIISIDRPVKRQFLYKFKYLNPDDVLKSMLPKSIKTEQVVLNKNNASLIFYISESEKINLFAYLESIDIPSPVIRYQLLIVEYMNSNKFEFDWKFGVNKKTTDSFAFNAETFYSSEGVIDANFDIPTVFGPSFSLTLTNKILSEKAKIQMSTQVYALSGEAVTLTNTKTLQYEDTITDVDTNTTKPVYNSTTFGLNIDIKGRATSGDEVFIEVSAKMSDEIPGQKGGKAPNTTEKSVKNSIRTKSGKPVVLGGLMDQKESMSNYKFPILGEIPFLGNLFKTHNNAYSNSEFVIYIIPFIQKSDEDINRERRDYIRKMYEYFF